jgi:hypothetical protein
MMHSHFWSGSADAPLVPVVSANGGYVAWQTTVIVGSGFGFTQVVWDWLLARTTTQDVSRSPR